MSKVEPTVSADAFANRSTPHNDELRDGVDRQLSRLLGITQLLSAIRHEALSPNLTSSGLAFRLELLSELIVECVEALHLCLLPKYAPDIGERKDGVPERPSQP